MRFVIAFVLAGWLPVSTQAASVYQEILESAYPADGPGATAIVVKDGDVLFRGARGMANIELGVPLTPDHVFRLASITKQFTAAAILLLEEDGKLSVDDPITKYLPDYPTHGHTITVEQLLTHTSGIYSYTSIPGYMSDGSVRQDLTTDELIEVFRNLPMQFAPGDRWSYNNSAYVLAGAIIERVSGQPYSEFIRERIFEPLGMDDSYYGGPQIIPLRVTGYAMEDGQYVNAAYISMTQPHAAGALLATVDDMARWNAGLFGGRLLSPASLEKMTTDHELNNGEPTGYGYGLGVRQQFGTPSLQHSGGINGFGTHGIWLPQQKVYVSVLSNNPQNQASASYVAVRMAMEAAGVDYPNYSAIDFDASRLAEYAGRYALSENFSIELSVKDGQLISERPGAGGPTPIHPFDTDAFFYPQSFTWVKFSRGPDGSIDGMELHLGGAEAPTQARRVPAEDDSG